MVDVNLKVGEDSTRSVNLNLAIGRRRSSPAGKDDDTAPMAQRRERVYLEETMITNDIGFLQCF